MPLTGALSDDFDDNVVDTAKWPNNFNNRPGGLPTETGGRARVPCDTGEDAYASDTIYTLAASQVSVQSFPPAGTGMIEAHSQLLVTSSTPGDQAIAEIDAATNLLSMTLQAGGVDEGGATIPYDSTDHAWLRIREDAGTLYWETAADGRDWTTRHTDTSPSWVSDTDLQIQLVAHCSPAVTGGGPTGEFAEFDNFNIEPVLPDGYTVAIDWNGDGDFNDTNEDVTSDVLASGPATFQYGRDQARALSPPRVGTLGFSLCNADGAFSPENPDSPISQDIAPAAPIKVEEVIDDTLYPLMTGRIDTFEIDTSRGRFSADITGLDDLSLLRGTNISTGLYQGQRTGALIGVILDEIGWTAPRDLDLGATHVPWWWANQEDAFDLLTQLLRSEGPPSIAYVAPDGTFIYRDRHHRILDDRSLTSQAVFTGGDVDCSTVPVTGAAGVPAGHLVGLDSDATEPTSSSASVTIPSDGTVIEGDLLLLGAAIPTGTGSLAVSSRRGDIFEDFEDSDLSVEVTGTWSRTNSESHTGAWCFTNADIGDSQFSDADVSVPPGAQTVQFWYRVSSELGFDFFVFLIDGVMQFFDSGLGVWTQSGTFDVSNAHTITFRYLKDPSISQGLDAAFVDDVQFTGTGDLGTWTSLGTAVRSGHTSQMWWRIAETADLGATVTVTPSVGPVRQVLLLGKVSDVDQDQPIIGASSVTASSTGAGITTPTVLDVPVGSREVSAVWDTRGASVPNTSSWTAPTGQTNQIEAFTTDDDGATSGAMGDSDTNVSGSVGGRPWTPDQDAIGSAWTVAVQDAVSQQTALGYCEPFEYEIGWRDIINDITFPVEERRPDTDLSVVWQSDAAISLALGESATVKVQASEPFRDAQDLVDGTDIVYTGTGVPVVLLSRTSGQSVTIIITAAGGTVNVSHLQLRARSVPVARTVEVSAVDSTSVMRHGDRAYPSDAPWVNRNDAQAVAQLLLAAYAERRPTVGLRIVSEDLAHHLQIVTRQISDRITIQRSELGLDADFHIETIGHTLARMVGEDTCPGPVHYATFQCERSGVVVPDNPFTFDKAGAGFDDGVFDPTGFDDPDAVFIFDHPVQGQFDLGQFGT